MIRDVELISVGMEWLGVNGAMTFTAQHLQDAMVAANEDPHIVAPRIKIGHDDPRFNPDRAEDHNPFAVAGDGEPALGSVRNLRLINDGATLIGDYVEIPVWLAEAAPSAYPNRSIEGAYSVSDDQMGLPIGSWDVETPGGKKYSFVLTACAMLGMSRPAVSDLEDLRRFLTEGEGLVVAGAAPAEGGVPADATIGAMPATATGAPPPAATADADKAVEIFCKDFCTDERYWWWPRALLLDPNVIIADDDEGSLWEVPISTDGDQNVTFGEPTRVLQTYVAAPAAAAAAMAATVPTLHTAAPVLSFDSRAATPAAERKKAPAEGGSTDSAPLRGMNFSDELRPKLAAKLGLSADATDEQITAALAAEGDPENTDPPAGNGEGGEGGDGTEENSGDGTGDGGDGEGGSGDGAGNGNGEGGGTAPADASGQTVSIDKDVLAELQAGAAAGTRLEAAAAEQRREAILTAAVKDGKIMPAGREAWKAKLAATPEAAEAELEALPKNLMIPVTEIGSSHSGAADLTTVTDEEMAAQFPGYGQGKAA